MEVAKPKYVWWDLDCCQIRRGHDPNEVRWIIESALNKKFGPGPVTIIAIGNINRIPRRVFELISVAGIFMKHTPNGGSSIFHDLMQWTTTHPAPAIMMLISDREYNNYSYFQALKNNGYTILRTYVNQKPDYSPIYAFDVWLWKNLLTETEEETPRPRQELQGDWFCKLCRLGGQSFTDFTMHLKTTPHLIQEWSAAHPNASVPPTYEELASLLSQLLKHVVPPKSPKRYKWEVEQTVPCECSVEPTEKDLPHNDLRHFLNARKQARAHGAS